MRRQHKESHDVVNNACSSQKQRFHLPFAWGKIIVVKICCQDKGTTVCLIYVVHVSITLSTSHVYCSALRQGGHVISERLQIIEYIYNFKMLLCLCTNSSCSSYHNLLTKVFFVFFLSVFLFLSFNIKTPYQPNTSKHNSS